jgi:5'(3')-deoxyribonucleotidase
MIVFIDMDGVLANFDGAIIKKFESKKLWDNRWDEVDPELFLNLEKMPDADQLVEYIRGMFDIHLLTAIPKKGRFEKSRVQKYQWAFNHYKIYPSKIHACYREEKQYFAVEENLSPNLLIDDHEGNVIEWRAKGGIAIHHTSTKNSIKELQQLGF